MFEQQTPEAIKAKILTSLEESQGISSMAGSFADGLAGPISEEISKVYMALDGVPSMLFVDEASGGYIDLVGAQYHNIIRREGTRASCQMAFTGTPGLVIPKGTTFLTAGGLAFGLEDQVTIGAEGTGRGRLTAQEVGGVYNVEENTLCRMYINLPGLTQYANEAASGGTDTESDAALLARIRERVRCPPTSGNGYQYRQWAMEVPGIGGAKVVELPEGPGTVGVTLVDSNDKAPSEEMVKAVEAHIQSVRPIGPSILVRPAAQVTITVEAAVTVSQGTDKGQVKTRLEEGLRRYLHDLIAGKFTPIYYSPGEDGTYSLLYHRVLAILLTIEGVEDFKTLTLNGGTEDLTLQAGEVPVLEEVAVT